MTTPNFDRFFKLFRLTSAVWRYDNDAHIRAVDDDGIKGLF